MKKERIISAIMAFCLIFCSSIPAFAAEVYSTEVYSAEDIIASTYNLEASLEKAKLGVTNDTISEEILNSITVSGGENSEVSYYVECLGTVESTTRGAGESNLYSVTATTKTKTDDVTKDNVFAWITVFWIDHSGTENELTGVSGGWEANGRTLSNRYVAYSAGKNGDHFWPDGDTFNKNDLSYFGLKIKAYSSVESGGYTDNPIQVVVVPTIFD